MATKITPKGKKDEPKPAAKGKSGGSQRAAAVSGTSQRKAAVGSGSSQRRPAVAVKAEPAPAAKGAKSPYAKDELAKWRQLLIEKRAEVSGDIAELEKDAMEAEDGHTTPNHIAERGSDAEMQDVSLGIAGDEKEIIWQIDRALRKIDTGMPIAFGLCEYTKEAISRGRLQLIPWTPLSIEGANHIEENGMTLDDVLIDD